MGEAKRPAGPVRDTGEEGPSQPGPRLFDWSQFDPSMILRDGADRLADELITYRDRLPELHKDEGRFVLIRGREVIGIYDSRDEALQEAAARFGDVPVLVKQIAAKEPVRDFGGVTS